MSVIMGLLLGAGLLLIWWSFWPQPITSKNRPPSKAHQLIARSGIARLTVPSVVMLSVVLALVVFVSLSGLTGAVPIGLCFALFAAATPWAALSWQANRRQTALREIWPDAIDNLRSAVRAGLTLPEALTQLADRGPEELRDVFKEFAADYRAGARFTDALDRLKQSLADPTADRLIASLKVTREVGGADIGRLLETLSDFLRDDARTRAELEARQSWTVNGARLAVVAPWLVLLLLATQPDAAAAYQSVSGLIILLGGVCVSVVCYQLMLKIGSLPAERRVL
ncbi:type II secretion system F family protein [Enteractinococcus helveticum]|uniref:Type II secretion system protein F n=1 Tax=Enteractinococcus helveticum TaxID=1837282 RepID=A0A1B7LWZ9_9MICC|nr:type II secretion system F family protein [Enteractinococcus helveticum]OAV59535.1 type II secretion system protein F [Enteractinococcus helveticum]